MNDYGNYRYSCCSYCDDVRSDLDLRREAYKKALTQMSNEIIADLLEQTRKNPTKFSKDDINSINDEAVSRLREKK